ncbi:MAG: MFS transporter [Candidatus Eremiobacteraeota bacterium]|nr:MFS transporter [Candidatus Eremiobacteraeota bacterium]
MATSSALHSGRGIPKLRYGIAFLLGFGVLINYFDRVNLSVAKDALHTDFGVDAVAFGILSSAYSYTYAALQIPVGVVLDRYGVMTVGRIAALLWSVASFLTAAAGNFASFFGARLVLGIGEAPTFPANAKAIGYWFPRHERGLATAIFDAAAKLGTAIAIPLISIVAANYGWRGAFAFTGILSLVFFLAFFAFYRNPSEDKRLSKPEYDYIKAGGGQAEGTLATGAGSRLGYLLRQRKVWGLTIGFSAYGYSFYLFLTWLPSYLSGSLHLGLIKSGWFAAIPWLIAAVADIVVGGWLVDFLIDRGFEPTRVRKTILVVGLLLGLAIVGATRTHDPVIATIWISIALAGLAASAPIGWSIPGLIAPKGSVGTVGAIMNFFNNLMGIIAPTVTGFIVGATNSFTNAFVAAAAFLVVGIFSYVFILGKIEPIPDHV